MEEQEQQFIPGQPMIAPAQDFGSQKERWGFDQEIKNLQVMFTGKRYVKGKAQVVFPHGTLCEKHFGQLVPKLYIANVKGVSLSTVTEEQASDYAMELATTTEMWMNRVRSCEECNLQDYIDISNTVSQMEMMFKYVLNRAKGGHEANLLASMASYQTTRIEDAREGKPGLFDRVLKWRR